MIRLGKQSGCADQDKMRIQEKMAWEKAPVGHSIDVRKVFQQQVSQGYAILKSCCMQRRSAPSAKMSESWRYLRRQLQKHCGRTCSLHWHQRHAEEATVPFLCHCWTRIRVMVWDCSCTNKVCPRWARWRNGEHRIFMNCGPRTCHLNWRWRRAVHIRKKNGNQISFKKSGQIHKWSHLQ